MSYNGPGEAQELATQGPRKHTGEPTLRFPLQPPLITRPQSRTTFNLEESRSQSRSPLLLQRIIYENFAAYPNQFRPFGWLSINYPAMSPF